MTIADYREQARWIAERHRPVPRPIIISARGGLRVEHPAARRVVLADLAEQLPYSDPPPVTGLPLDWFDQLADGWQRLQPFERRIVKVAGFVTGVLLAACVAGLVIG